MGLLSDRMLLDFGMALSTAVLIAITIRSVYLSRSLVEVSQVKSAEPSAACLKKQMTLGSYHFLAHGGGGGSSKTN